MAVLPGMEQFVVGAVGTCVLNRRRKPRVDCPKCGMSIIHYKLDRHIDDGMCRTQQALKRSAKEGLYPPSDLRASTNTVLALAKWVGITLEKRPIRYRDHGTTWRSRADKLVVNAGCITERYEPVRAYVAPEWLCRIAAYKRRIGNCSKPFLRRLKEARDNIDLQKALIVQAKLTGIKK